jgi:hypothetical protein
VADPEIGGLIIEPLKGISPDQPASRSSAVFRTAPGKHFDVRAQA